MAISVYVHDIDRRFQIADQAYRRPLREIPVARAFGNRDVSVEAELDRIDAPVFIHVAQSDHHGPVAGTKLRPLQKGRTSLVDVGNRRKTGNRRYQVGETVVVQVPARDPARRLGAVSTVGDRRGNYTAGEGAGAISQQYLELRRRRAGVDNQPNRDISIPIFVEIACQDKCRSLRHRDLNA